MGSGARFRKLGQLGFVHGCEGMTGRRAEAGRRNLFHEMSPGSSGCLDQLSFFSVDEHLQGSAVCQALWWGILR